MIDGASVLSIIPARGGSKGLPRKNVLPLGGRPLIQWTVAASRASRHVDRTILSTDDAEIAARAREAGCEVPFMRPPELATDEASTVDVILHALQALEAEGARFDYTVVLQPTSPLRLAEDIDACIELCHRAAAPSCVSLSPAKWALEWIFRLGPDGVMAPVTGQVGGSYRRQDASPCFGPNGAVYVGRTEQVRAARTFYGPGTVGHVMPAERSIDIDTRLDMAIAETVLAETGRTSAAATAAASA